MLLPKRSSAKSSASPDEADRLALPPGAIDLALLAKLPSIALQARYFAETFLTGRHRSPLRGTSPEFAEYRAYQPGDDLRRIDWRLYGRSDRLAVKQYEDENQLRVCLALDLSASMRYASRSPLLSKFDFARVLLAATVLLARRQHDAVGLALIGETGIPGQDGICEFLRPGSSPIHLETILSRLESPPVARTASLPCALQRLAGLLPGGGLLVVASDFYCNLPELDQTLGLLRFQNIEAVGFQVLDPQEIDLTEEISAQVVDLESGASLPLNTLACRGGYLRRFGAFRRELTERFRAQESELLLQRTDSDPLTSLAAFWSRRPRPAR